MQQEIKRGTPCLFWDSAGDPLGNPGKRPGIYWGTDNSPSRYPHWAADIVNEKLVKGVPYDYVEPYNPFQFMEPAPTPSPVPDTEWDTD